MALWIRSAATWQATLFPISQARRYSATARSISYGTPRPSSYILASRTQLLGSLRLQTAHVELGGPGRIGRDIDAVLVAVT